MGLRILISEPLRCSSYLPKIKQQQRVLALYIMKRSTKLLRFGLTWMASAATNCAIAATTGGREDSPLDPRLNLVILFADNLGYDDVSCFQPGDVRDASVRSTPNIDRLADEGMKFSNWNSAAALCSPSRSALLTGKYPVRTGTYPGVFQNDASYGLLPDETTIAELLKVEGYATSIV